MSRLAVVETGRRRRWSEAKKLRIVEESLSTPRNASATARRYGISPQLLFAWRRNWRKERLGEEPLRGFVPVVVGPEASGSPRTGGTGGRMEVVAANGRRVVLGLDFDPPCLLVLMTVGGASAFGEHAAIRILAAYGLAADDVVRRLTPPLDESFSGASRGFGPQGSPGTCPSCNSQSRTMVKVARGVPSGLRSQPNTGSREHPFNEL